MADAPEIVSREGRVDRQVAAAVVIAVAAFFAGLFGLANRVDAVARDREQVLAGNILRGEIAELEALVPSIADWDDAVANLDQHLDQDWANAEIGHYFCHSLGFTFAAVLNGADAPIYGLWLDQPATDGQFAAIAADSGQLIAAIREAEARRGPFSGQSRNGQEISEPIQASAFVTIGGSLAMVTATLVQPDFGTVLPAGPKAPIVVTGKMVDAKFLEYLGQRLQLAELHLVPIAAKREASILLNDMRDRPIGRLAWTPSRPGDTMMSVTVLPMLAIVGLPLGLYFHARRTSQLLRLAAKELSLARDAANEAAMTDHLTGLHNRMYLDRLLRSEMVRSERYAHPLGVVMIDLDHFKGINDRFGHQEGDKVLIRAAEMLSENCRRTDTVGRYGGEEFMVILPDTRAEESAAVAEKLRAALALADFGAVGSVTASFGVGNWRGGDRPETLIARADAALYLAKDLGRNRVEVG